MIVNANWTRAAMSALSTAALVPRNLEIDYRTGKNLENSWNVPKIPAVCKRPK
jgi:hypothetical protein